MSRFSRPLSNDVKLTFPALPVMATALDEMARFRGVSRAEVLRRIVAKAIVDDGGNVPDGEGEELEYLADLI